MDGTSKDENYFNEKIKKEKIPENGQFSDKAIPEDPSFFFENY
jgi:hypothetical protein